MTETEWLTCPSPDQIVYQLPRETSARKLRLYACACCDCVQPLYAERWYREMVDVARAFADDSATAEALREAYVRIQAEVDAKGEDDHDAAIKRMFCAARRAVYGATKPDAKEAAWYAASNARTARAIRVEKEEPAIQLALFHDIFGNPFRPAVFAPEWRTDTTVAFARAMYDACDLSAMPILADALQEAGCDSDAVLSHCRDATQVHVRGCWVCDLVLGKA
jgi:hypothetical protein